MNVHSWEEWLSAVQELPTFTQLLRAFVIGGPIREMIFGRSIYSNWLLSMIVMEIFGIEKFAGLGENAGTFSISDT